MKEFVIVVNEEQEYSVGQCSGIWEAREKFVEKYPEISLEDKDVIISIRSNKTK